MAQFFKFPPIRKREPSPASYYATIGRLKKGCGSNLPLYSVSQIEKTKINKKNGPIKKTLK